MYVTWKNFKHITFPVYRTPSDNWYSADGVLFMDGLVLDDKNQPGKTLGVRRLQTHFSKLVPLPKAYESILALIKNPKGPYIDTAGNAFFKGDLSAATVTIGQIASFPNTTAMNTSTSDASNAAANASTLAGTKATLAQANTAANTNTLSGGAKTGGSVGGWTITSSAISSANIVIDSTNQRILISDSS